MTTIHAERVSISRTEQGDHEYLVEGSRVYAATPAEAIQTFYQRRIERLSVALAERSAPDAAYAAVGAALRAGGAIRVVRESDGVMSYVAAGRTMGYASETHATPDGSIWLRVAVDRTGLDALKSRIDRGELV